MRGADMRFTGLVLFDVGLRERRTGGGRDGVDVGLNHKRLQEDGEQGGEQGRMHPPRRPSSLISPGLLPHRGLDVIMYGGR